VPQLPRGFNGDKAVNVPWGLNIDGNDDVWIGNFWGRGVVLMAGAGTKGHPAGTKTGDAIHAFQGGSIQMLTDSPSTRQATSGRRTTGTASMELHPPIHPVPRRRGVAGQALRLSMEWRHR
jgi:hypothetical protein